MNKFKCSASSTQTQTINLTSPKKKQLFVEIPCSLHFVNHISVSLPILFFLVLQMFCH